MTRLHHSTNLRSFYHLSVAIWQILLLRHTSLLRCPSPKWALAGLNAHGGDPTVSIKKPLNAFLKELFFASWNDGKATSNLAAEQVSHHPPITAVYMWDKENGISGEGYTCVEMKFAGSIDVKQAGHALVHIDKYDEDHLIPLPNLRVKGFLSGRLCPELYGVYHIVSSSGYVSELRFEGDG
jgi:hypothetical protein